MPIISVTGETSSLAATRGKRLFPKAVAPAKICVKLNCFCVARIKGVKASGRKPVNALFSATNIRANPGTFATSSATFLA